MRKRPTSVSVIAWILIIKSGMSLIMGTVILNNPKGKEIIAKSLLSVPLLYTILYVGILITIVSGIGMLKGKNWARILYVVWSVINFSISFATSPMKPIFIPGVVLFGVITFFLFRPKANDYFSSTEAASQAARQPIDVIRHRHWHRTDRMSKRPRNLVIIVGAVAVLTALFGLYYNGRSIVVALRGGFSDFVAQRGLTYFYAAFYLMSATCVICYLLLLVLGVGLLLVRLRWSRLLTGVLIFEVVYFLTISFLWVLPGVGISIAAATGVTNGGLMPQFIILFPIWAPLVLWWARRKIEHEKPAD